MPTFLQQGLCLRHLTTLQELVRLQNEALKGLRQVSLLYLLHLFFIQIICRCTAFTSCMMKTGLARR